MAVQPLVVIDIVGLTRRWLSHAPQLARLAQAGQCSSLNEVLPAVTCTVQASMLTGRLPAEHGIVANGWLYRDTGEVRFWQQSNRLLQAEPVYATARREANRRQRAFKSAKLFWWFNQGAAVDISITPKPWYGADGNKAFGIYGTPGGLSDRLERQLGPFPFKSFWGPLAGRPASEWIGLATAAILRDERPDLTLTYLPHLDYEPQRHGPAKCDMATLVRELDDCCAPILDAAQAQGARVWVVNEYGHVNVQHAIEPNRALRRGGLLAVRPGPFGETLDTFESRAFAVCDHQCAHVYVRDDSDVPLVRETLEGLPGIARVLSGAERTDIGLNHSRSGELILFSASDSWFAYPYWLDDRLAPDFARTVDIHRKPGFDPCELHFDAHHRWPKARVPWRLVQKKLGLRALMDIVPLDSSVVGGSHGLLARSDEDRPLMIADHPGLAEPVVNMQELAGMILEALDLVPA
jgi:predicted AlkP superfamily pyrophosphatase or phosphodiesterase